MASGRENEPMLLYWGWVPVNSTVRDGTPLEEGWGWDKQSLTEPPCRSEPLPDEIISARVEPAFVNALQLLKPGSSWKLISSAQSCFFSSWVGWWAIAFPQREGQNYVSLFCINSSATSAGARWSLKKKKKQWLHFTQPLLWGIIHPACKVKALSTSQHCFFLAYAEVKEGSPPRQTWHVCPMSHTNIFLPNQLPSNFCSCLEYGGDLMALTSPTVEMVLFQKFPQTDGLCRPEVL